ncbi:MAG: carbohydrate ABC transporter permease [Clostridiales bacterium]|nr:carbohydrate ABC transporter permease [Clostridiales bacterium]
MKFRKKDIWKYIVSLFLVVIYLFPFFVIINVSLKSYGDTTSRIQFPETIYWGNYQSIISSGEIFNGIRNCVIITVLVLVVEIVVGCMAAYALARNQSKLNEVVRSLIMSVMMISPLTILVGVYSMMSKINAISTYWGITLLLGSFGLPMVIFLYSNFISSIPVALDEAASIDGASNLKIFFNVILPQLKPVTVTVIIIQGVNVWNEYTYSYYFLQKSSMKTITLVIKSFFSTVLSDYGSAAAAAVIGMLPLCVVYLFLQKYFIQGQMDSAIKS